MQSLAVTTCGLVMLGLAGVVEAQQSVGAAVRRSYFVDGGILADREGRVLPTWRPGLALAWGGFFSPRRSLRVDLRVPAWGSREYERDIPSALTGELIPLTTQIEERTIAYSGLVGFHYRSDRPLAVTPLLGLGGIAITDSTRNIHRVTGAVVNAGSSTQRAIAIAAGLEGTWAVSARIAVVAQVIVHVGVVRDANEATTAMPSVVLRWLY